jgi:hypothetical protein
MAVMYGGVTWADRGKVNKWKRRMRIFRFLADYSLIEKNREIEIRDK